MYEKKIVKTQHFAGVRANTPEGRAHAGKFKRMPLLFNTFGKTILTILSDLAPTITFLDDVLPFLSFFDLPT